MIINKQLANSKGISQKDKWGTDPKLFQVLHNEFFFSLDPCCEIETAKCDVFFTSEMNGLIQSWENQVVYMNPPYSRGNIDKWVEKACEERKHAVIVALLPVSTSARWWHKYVDHKAIVRYIQGRVKFEGAESTAPFSSAIAIYGKPVSYIRNIEKLKGGDYKINFM
jgi:site-specific DNA-methyltransferase (adenine-specific)